MVNGYPPRITTQTVFDCERIVIREDPHNKLIEIVLEGSGPYFTTRFHVFARGDDMPTVQVETKENAVVPSRV